LPNLAIKQKLKYRYGIIFTYFGPDLRPNNDKQSQNLPKTKKQNKTKEVKTLVVKENAQRLALHLVV